MNLPGEQSIIHRPAYYSPNTVTEPGVSLRDIKLRVYPRTAPSNEWAFFCGTYIGGFENFVPRLFRLSTNGSTTGTTIFWC